jgi:uncharacterized membrane protein
MEGVPTLVAYAASAALFSQLPPAGNPDWTPLLPPGIIFIGGPVPRIVAALLIPTVSLAVWILLTLLAKVRGPVMVMPQWWLNEQTGAASVAKFEPTYNTIVFSITALMALVHILFLASLLHWPDWAYRAVTIVFGFGLMAVGNVMPRVRPNWIVGLRTKRTLSDPVVWAKAHRALGTLLMAFGALVILASIVAPRYAFAIGFIGLPLVLPIAYIIGTQQASNV